MPSGRPPKYDEHHKAPSAFRDPMSWFYTFAILLAFFSTVYGMRAL